LVAFALLLFAAQDYAGSASCAACHPGQAGAQLASRHARALARERNRWAFGAGAQAKTFVSQIDEDTHVEHGLSWYRKSNGLALTPGHSTPDGVPYRTFAPDSAILRCFQCHSTGSLTVSEDRAIVPREPGVRCEACHGPGAAHAAGPTAQNILSPKQLSAPALNDLCGRCHRMPPARGVETNFDNPWNVRHQPVYLSRSACFTKSGGRLSCVSCHNPHEDGKTAAEARCSGCHANQKHTAEVSGRSCVSCHMPVVEASPLLAFTNHWIGVYALAGARPNPLRPIEQRTRR
jgi:hypothetical protein